VAVCDVAVGHVAVCDVAVCDVAVGHVAVVHIAVGHVAAMLRCGTVEGLGCLGCMAALLGSPQWVGSVCIWVHVKATRMGPVLLGEATLDLVHKRLKRATL
jgi:hypothetical protein